MSRVKALFNKEFKDSIRDRRALMMAMLPAIIGPVLMVFMFSMIAETRSSEDALTVQVIGQEFAPDLIAYLAAREVKFERYVGEPKQDIQDEKVTLVLEISDDYAQQFGKSQPSSVYIHSDSSLEKSETDARRLTRLMETYSASIGNMRLIVRGINPSIARTLSIQSKDYSTDASRAGQILAGLQMIILMAAFFGSAPTAIDTTAGERERKSLEPLLVNPLTSMQLLLGKYLTVATFGFCATLLSVVVTAEILNLVSLKALGVDPKLTFSMQLNILLILLPMALFAASLQMLTSLFAKSFKEAQSYLGLLTMLPMIPVFASMVGAVKSASWMYTVPVLGQQQLLFAVLRGDGLDLLQFGIATTITLAITAILLLILARLLRSERVVYGG